MSAADDALGMLGLALFLMLAGAAMQDAETSIMEHAVTAPGGAS